MNWQRLVQWILSLVGREQPTIPTTPPPQGDEAAKCVYEHNVIRKQYGLPEFVGDACLAAQAQSHAEEMRRTNRLTHDGFSVRLNRCGRGWGSENVAWNYNTGKSVTEGWMNSAGHRQNIFNESYTSIGVGYAHPYWCAMYA